MDRSSLEELLTPIVTTDDPTGFAVRVAVLPDGDRPEAGDWHDADWVTVDGTPHASLLVGPGGVVELGPGAYHVWVEITAPPEKPVLASQRFYVD